jgi:hypothetical protein
MTPRVTQLLIHRRDPLAAEDKPDAGKIGEQIHELRAVALIKIWYPFTGL